MWLPKFRALNKKSPISLHPFIVGALFISLICFGKLDMERRPGIVPSEAAFRYQDAICDNAC